MKRAALEVSYKHYLSPIQITFSIGVPIKGPELLVWQKMNRKRKKMKKNM